MRPKATRLDRSPVRLAAAAFLGLALSAAAHAQNEPGQPGRGPGAAGQDGERPRRQVDPAMAARRFMQMDANGDGKLSKEEAGDGPGARLFPQMDTDGDGFVTTEEITVFFANRPARGGDRGPGMERPGRGEGPGGPGGPQAAPAGPSKEAFHDAMERAGRALRGLRRTSFEADTFERDFGALLELEATIVEARRNASAIEMSDAAKAKFGDDRVAYQRSFQLHMTKALMATLQVEMAVLEGNGAKAKELVNGILENRNESHDLFEQE